jgi:hypothetical protein
MLYFYDFDVITYDTKYVRFDSKTVEYCKVLLSTEKSPLEMRGRTRNTSFFITYDRPNEQESSIDA